MGEVARSAGGGTISNPHDLARIRGQERGKRLKTSIYNVKERGFCRLGGLASENVSGTWSHPAVKVFGPETVGPWALHDGPSTCLESSLNGPFRNEPPSRGLKAEGP